MTTKDQLAKLFAAERNSMTGSTRPIATGSLRP